MDAFPGSPREQLAACLAATLDGVQGVIVAKQCAEVEGRRDMSRELRDSARQLAEALALVLEAKRAKK
jgi:hypothetical protein